MRFGSPGPLRRAMSSSSYYYRRASHRPRRTFSARPSPPPPPPHDAAPDAELVSGDAHFSAVRAANDALRRGGGGRAPWAPPPTYGYGSQPRYGHGHGHGHQRQRAPLYGYGSQPPYGYGQGHRQQPASPYGYGSQLPYGYGHPQQPPSPYGYGAPPPYGYGHPQPYGGLMPNVAFQPSTQQQPSVPLQPRLAVYRRWWRFAQQRLPHNAERFKVLSYNILADYLAKEHQELYNHIPDYILDWNWRKDKLLFEFGLWSPDIICLQEVDKFPDLEQELASRGYNGVWKMRTGKAADGCAVFWKTDRFQLCYEEHIEFNKLDLRDNIAQICVLESTVPRNVQTESSCLPTSSNDPQQAKQVVICNIHVLYNPRRGDIKLGQVRMLLERAYAASKMWNDAPVILCGDFNSTPKSPLYNFISQQKLDLSGLARHEISGQYSTSSSQRPYTRYNMSRPFPSRATNSRDGIMTSLNNLRPQTETTNLEQKSCPAGREPVLANTSSSAAEDAHRSDGQVQGISHHADTAESQECSRVGSSSEGCSGGAKLESGQEPKVADYPSNPSMVNSEILPSDSGEIVDSSRLDLSSESSGFKYSFEESEGSNNVPVALEDMHSDVISEKVTCDLEENSVQSDTQEGVSKDNPVEKEKANEFMLCQNHRTNNGSESSELSDSLKLADTVNQMNNIRLEEESNSEATNLTSPAKSTKLPNSATSDVCDQHCTSEVTNQDSDCAPLSSCSNNFENDNCALEDDKTVSEVSCSDENSDPSFFKELVGDDGCLLEDEDQLPTTSDGPPFEQEEVTSAEKYYDPYRWTPEEIRAASGNEACTLLEHKLKVRSVYTDVEDYEGTKDVNEEPQVTSYNTKFMGTVDYIWASEDLQTIQVLDTFPKDILKQTRGFPTKKWGSDHIALVCELAFTKGS